MNRALLPHRSAVPAAIGLLVTIVGGVAIWGLLRRSVLLVQLHPGYPPIQFNAAICLVLLGASLLGVAVGRASRGRLAAVVTAGLSTLLAAAVFAQYLFGRSLGIDSMFFEPWASQFSRVPGRFAPNVALAFLMIGAALLLLAHRRSPFAGAALGAVAFTLGASVLIGHLAGTPELFTWPDQNPMGVVTAVCLVFLGCGVVVAASNRVSTAPGRVWWGPLLTAVAISAAGLLLWNALRVEHTRRVQAVVQADAVAVRSEIAGALRLPIDRLRLFAARLQLPVISIAADQVPGISNVQWYAVTPATRRRSLETDEDGEGPSQQGLLDIGLAYAGEQRSLALVGPFTGPGGEAQIHVVAPVIRDGSVLGFLMGAIPTSAFAEVAEAALADRSLEIEVFCGAASVFQSTGSLASAASTVTSDLRLPGPLTWNLVATAAPGSSLSAGAELPEVVLGIMLTTALLLALSTQLSRSQASRADRLTDEVRDRSRKLRVTLRTLRRTNAAKDHFIGMLGHELRNPLGAILAATDLLRRGGRETEAIEVIEQEGEHLSRVLDDLLDVARIERGQLSIERKPLDLVGLVRDVVSSHRFVVDGGNHDIALDVPPDPVRLRADATRIRQVVGNLLANAAKFSPPGGSIEVEVSADHVRRRSILRIRNQGEGIEADDLTRIFEPFVQTKTDLMEERTGLGLGLPIVRGLVEAHGGVVYAQSAGADRGAEFFVELPIAEAAEDPVLNEQTRGDGVGRPASPEAEDDRDAGASAGAADGESDADDRASTLAEHSGSPVVLLIEDHVNAAHMMRQLIMRYGYDVEVAHDGDDGLAAAARKLPDLVLCDLGLPGITGYEVAERLRHDPSFADIPIIAISGYGREQDIARAREAGFTRHLIKPVSPAKLRAVLDQYLRSS